MDTKNEKQLAVELLVRRLWAWARYAVKKQLQGNVPPQHLVRICLRMQSIEVELIKLIGTPLPRFPKGCGDIHARSSMIIEQGTGPEIIQSPENKNNAQ